MMKLMIKSNELRIGNLVNLFKGVSDDGAEYKVYEMGAYDIYKVDESDCDDIEAIPLTPETIEKYIDWEFELNFNKSVQQYEEWTTHWYLLENIIDGTSDFTIDFRINNKDCNLSFVDFYLDDKHLEFGLDDTMHNLQNLFYIVSGQELPIKL